MISKRSAKAFAIFNLLLVAGCSSSGNYFPAAGDKPFKVESEPAGAAVYVMGEKIGETPIMISHKDVFPNIYPRGKESVYGRITLKKEGCLDLTRTVSAEISNAGLHARLDCGDLGPAPAGAGLPRNSVTVEQRLDKIKDLLGKGLITEEEAKKARERILGDL
ncbi:MAG TPA: PEGA domain-containing protein [Gallionella sp.]|nr:PEGA domain-containing protein [Gallionella sp.]